MSLSETPIVPSTWYSIRTQFMLPTKRCFSFDDGFNGLISPPHVLRATGWALVRTEVGMSGEIKPKPGYRADTRGASLLLSSEQRGAQQLEIGFLSSPLTNATAVLVCKHGCTCGRLRVNAHSRVATSVTRFTPPHWATASGGTCEFALTLENGDGGFKFIALHVSSREVS